MNTNQGSCQRVFIICAATAAGLLFTLARPSLAADEASPPVIPVGMDAFLQWDRWPCLRIGQRTYMRSTYDRRGANEAADASHFLYQLDEDHNVSLDVMGTGVLAFKRTNHWHGSPWHYIIDGRDYVVTESSTPDPDHPKEGSVFIPEEQFPNPLTWTWSITRGADLMWVPLMFEKSLSIAYGRTHYGTGYYIYHLFMPGIEHLSRPIKSWDMDVPPKAVLDLLNRSGSDLVADKGHIRQRNMTLLPGEPFQVFKLEGRSQIRAINMTVEESQAIALGNARMKIWWDDRAEPSVDAPVSLLFGTGTLYNRDSKEWLVKAFPVHIRFADGKAHLGMYFPMPYMKSARIELTAAEGEKVSGLDVSFRTDPYTGPANHVGYFHATYVDHGEGKPGHDLEFLDTRKVEGGGDWCGQFIGTSFIFTDTAELRTLEGDPRFYFDDALTPSAQGTGTEEWGGGGDYWGGRTMTLPFAGHPVGCKKPQEARNDLDKIHSEYRFLLSDCFPFGRNARITFEHGGENNMKEHYRSVTFWYGRPGAYLVPTDEFNVGDAASEMDHQYRSPEASEPRTISTRYEWGVDHFEGREIFPESSDTERHTRGSSTFVMKLQPDNLGVLLRRKMDYSFPNQLAKVSVSDVDGEPKWTEVGLWYTAGSNTCVYSNPKPELGPAQHNAQTSNRRWREEEFMLPKNLTAGRDAIRVKVEFVPREIPLFPGHPLAEQAWSEVRYWAYCFQMPE